MSWEKIKIGDLGIIVTGKTPPTSDKENYGTKIPFITPVDMVDNRNIFFTERYLSENGKNAVKNCYLPPNTVCVSCIGSDMGKVVITTEYSVTNQQINSIIVDKSYNYLFVYYLMLTKQPVIKSLGKTATAVPILNKSKFSNIEVKVPDINTQNRIASILSTYDDLIENNQKQIKLLEEAAQRLYKEWFVDLRFPGYENTKIVDGVPEGWKHLLIGDVISYEIGGGWGNDIISEKFEKPAYVIRGTEFYGITHGNISDIPYRYHTERNLCARALTDGDIIFEVSGGSKTEGVARTLLIRDSILNTYRQPVMCASFCKLIRFDDKKIAQYMYDTFLYLRSCGKTTEFDKKSASSIVNYRWSDFLNQQFVLIPSENILQQYRSLAENYYNLIICNSIQIEKLKNARDRLLPKLMSGELEV